MITSKHYLTLAALIIALSSSLAMATEPSRPHENATNRTTITSQALHGFERCTINEALAATITRLMATAKPIKKDNTAWTYAIKAQLFGLPAKEMQIGVCGVNGERDCGWGSFLAVVVARPPEEVKKHLQKLFEADFTQEKREPELNVTLRPVLVKGRQRGESILFCDPGDL